MARFRFATFVLCLVTPVAVWAQDPYPYGTPAHGTPASGTPVRRTPTITLKRTFSPNPIEIKGVTGMPNLSLERHFGTKYRNCRGYVSRQPDLVLYLPRGLPKTRLVMKGGGVIHIRLPNRRYVCNSHGYPRNTILMNQWPAGRLEVRVGTYHKRYRRTRPLNFTLTLEDLSRPRNLGWNKTLAKLPVTQQMARPIVFTSNTTAAQGKRLWRSFSSCSRHYFRHQPDFLIKAERPIVSLYYNLASHKDVMFLLVGPLTKDGRRIPRRCLYQGHSRINRLEPGVYGVKIGTKRGHTKVPYTLLIRTRNTQLKPLELVRNVPTQLSLWQRRLYNFYPQIRKGALYRHRRLAQAVFANAPKQLFVFPAFDFDKASASQLPSNYKNTEYPKKNEPMLVIGRGWVVGADGSAWRVSRDSYLRLSPDGPVAIPERARNLYQRYSSALANRGPEDARAIKAYERAVKRNSKCIDRVWRPVERRIDRIRSRRPTLWRLRKIRILKDRAEARAYRSCGTKRLGKMKERLHKRMMRTRTARRTALLARLRPRLLKLFQ